MTSPTRPIPEQIKRGLTLEGPFLPEPLAVLTVDAYGPALKIVGRGVKTNQLHDVTARICGIAQNGFGRQGSRRCAA